MGMLTVDQTNWFLYDERSSYIQMGLIDNDESKAKLTVNNPTGERALHYDIVKYIRKTYPKRYINKFIR